LSDHAAWSSISLSQARAMADQRIVGYHLDEVGDWVAELACGHYQHVRHDPPWIQRPWVVTAEGRTAKLGFVLACRKCDQGAPRDRLTAPGASV